MEVLLCLVCVGFFILSFLSLLCVRLSGRIRELEEGARIQDRKLSRVMRRLDCLEGSSSILIDKHEHLVDDFKFFERSSTERADAIAVELNALRTFRRRVEGKDADG